MRRWNLLGRWLIGGVMAVLVLHGCRPDNSAPSVSPSHETVGAATATDVDTDMDSQGPPNPAAEAMLAKSSLKQQMLKQQMSKKRKTPLPPIPPLLLPENLSAPTVIGELNESAYGKKLFVDGSSVIVLTPTAMHRFAQGASPTQVDLDLGYSATMADGVIWYWSKGGVYSVPVNGGAAVMQGEVAIQPMQIVAAAGRAAWLAKDDSGAFLLQRFEQKVTKVLYRSTGMITSVTAVKRWVFFIESLSRESWRLGRVPLNGEGAPVFSEVLGARTPSMIVGGGSGREEGVYYFDLPTRSVYRASVDLKETTVVAQHLVCSPVAVADRIFCARVEGIYALEKNGSAGHLLTSERVGLIAAIAGNSELVAFINDTGESHLTLRMVPLGNLKLPRN